MNRKIKKVLLFIPPAFTRKDSLDINPLPPLGLAYLAAVLESRDIKVKIIDTLAQGWNKREEINADTIRVGLGFEQIEEAIRDFSPDMVGVNNLFTKQRDNAHRIYALAKKVNPGIVTVAGGAHPTVMPELALSDTNLDYVVIGEGEQTLIDLINVIEGKGDIHLLDGIGYKNGAGVKVIPKTKFIDNLDSLPMPARHLLNMDNYYGLKTSHGERICRRFSPVISSRGCPAQCAFCSAHNVWGSKFRYRSAENVIAELKHLKEDFGIEEILFEDDNLTLDTVRAERIFDGMVKERLNLKWDTPNGIAAWTLSEKLIDKMKESGCYRLNFAIESGNQKVLSEIIRKPLNLEKVKPLIRYAGRKGIKTGIYLVLGMPGETEEQMWDSFHFAKELGIFSPFISIATPYPGSELYKLCQDKGYLKDDFTLDDLYIRSFSISTDTMDSKRIKEILAEGQRYLLFASLRKAPLPFIGKVAMRFIRNPIVTSKKIYRFIRAKIRNTDK